MKRLLICAVLLGFTLAGCNQMATNVKEKPVKLTGIRKAPLTKDMNTLPVVRYTEPPPVPGKVKPLKRAFVTAPPQIPHSIAGLVPITLHNNACLGCHLPQNAKAMNVIPVSPDHLNGNRIKGARYNCTQCHVPQAKVNPLVENKFESLR